MEIPQVYTYVSTGYDNPRSKGLLFTEEDVNLFKETTRNARMVKILSHYFISSEWSLWVDGDIELQLKPEEILEKYKDKGDLIVFKHRARNCVYDEAVAVFLGKRENNHKIVDEQVAFMRNEGYPEQNGLFETGCLLRRNCPEINRFNEMWWANNCRFSKRDQLSANYCAWKTGIKVGHFEGNMSVNDDFYLHGHLPNPDLI